MSKEIVELACRKHCPFQRECGWSFLGLKRICIENTHAVIEALRDSLSENPALEHGKSARQYSDPNLVFIANRNEILIDVNRENGVLPFSRRINLGEIKSGFLNFGELQEEVVERIKDKAPIVIKPQS